MSPKVALPQDFADLLAEFASADVRYLIIGGYAVGFHDRPRTTKDIDVLLDPDRSNVEKACRALAAFGAPESVISDLFHAKPDEITWFGAPPVRVDILLDTPGLEFSEAFSRRETAEWGGVVVSIVSLEDLIRSKVAAGRPQDSADVLRLERILSSRR